MASFLKLELFRKRLNRTNYLLGTLLLCFGFIPLLLLILFSIPHDPKPVTQNPTVFEAFLTAFTLIPVISIYPICAFSLMVRRMHDLDRENIYWWPSWAYDLYFKAGTHGANKYGEPQKGIGILQILGIK